MEDEIKIEEDYDNLVVFISMPSRRTDHIEVSRCNKFGHYDIKLPRGAKPKELEGTFTDRSDAVGRVVRYLINSKKASSVKRAEIRKDREDGAVNN